MRRLVMLGLAPLVLTMACARANANDPPTEPPSATGSASVASRDAQIYAAVLRRYLTTPGENANQQATGVFVLDHADADAADPMRTTTKNPVAIPTADQQSITAALRDVAAITFVASREQVIVDADTCGTVRGNGILILLSPPAAAGAVFHVGINGYATCLGATWHTYVVARDGGSWTVTGTTGPVAIS